MPAGSDLVPFGPASAERQVLLRELDNVEVVIAYREGLLRHADQLIAMRLQLLAAKHQTALLEEAAKQAEARARIEKAGLSVERARRELEAPPNPELASARTMIDQLWERLREERARTTQLRRDLMEEDEL